MASTSTVLITGATRGLGKAIVTHYLSLSSHTVIALNRDPSAEGSRSLYDLPVAEGSKLLVVKNDASSPTDPFAAVEELKNQDIKKLDLVFANAAVGTTYPFIKDVKYEDLQAHFEANVFGVVMLFQATRELLLAAENPKWVTMGSSAGCLTNQNPVPSACYGPSKAAAHWLTKRLDAEEEKMTVLVMDPGWVQTDMGNLGAVTYGFEKAPLEIAESIKGVVKVVDEAKKETHGGKMWVYNGKEQVW